LERQGKESNVRRDAGDDAMINVAQIYEARRKMWKDVDSGGVLSWEAADG
jgi:hypothetical protein